MATQTSIRIHRFNDTVGLSFPDSVQLYLESGDALVLARELVRFANACENRCPRAKKWPVTRLVQRGQAVNESNGKSRPGYLP